MPHETSISPLLNHLFKYLHSNEDLVFVLWDAEWHRLVAGYWWFGKTLVPSSRFKQSKNKKIGPICCQKCW